MCGRNGVNRERDSARATGPALEACYRFILSLVPTVEKFPRSQKFLLGDRMATDLRYPDAKRYEFAALPT